MLAVHDVYFSKKVIYIITLPPFPGPYIINYCIVVKSTGVHCFWL